METIRWISSSILENNDNQHLVDNPADLRCTSTQNVQNTDIAVSVRNKCGVKKIKINPIKSAKDLPQTNTLICLEKYLS